VSSAEYIRKDLKAIGLGFTFELDQDGYVQTSRLIEKPGRIDLKSQDFKFDLEKVVGLTVFQKKIYRELIKIPPGRTVSYLELGKKAGYTNASRAVGTAMAKNKLILFVPCHRVVRSDGSFGNFSGCGGSVTKQRLLELEASKGDLY